MSETGYSAIDLFCGAGGFSEGLSWAGFDVIWATDSDEKATQTYAHNHPETRVHTGDITAAEFPELGLEKPLDLVAGGPPCPTFSVIGRAKLNSLEGRDSTSDERHQLWQDFVRAVGYYSPRAFVMENVEGMASAENDAGHRVLPYILEKLRNQGYRVDWTVVDAADFGVPQRRKRLFIIGNRENKPNPDLTQWQTHREPVNSHEKIARLLSHRSTDADQQTLGEFVESDSEKSGTELDIPSTTGREAWETVAEAILDLPPLSPAGNNSHGPENSHPPSETTEYQIPALTSYQRWARNIPENGNWENQPLYNHSARFHNMTDLSLYKALSGATGWTIQELGEELQPYRSDIFTDNYTKQAPGEPASTIDAHIHKDGHRHIHPTEARSLTVREAARLQSFRDTYEFPMNRTAAYKQVGNAVPPLLAKRIGQAICETILE